MDLGEPEVEFLIVEVFFYDREAFVPKRFQVHGLSPYVY
jgi:hypothetical protein